MESKIRSFVLSISNMLSRTLLSIGEIGHSGRTAADAAQRRRETAGPPAYAWCTAPLGRRRGEPGYDVPLLRLHTHPWLPAVGEDGGGQHPPRRGKSLDLQGVV